MGLRRCSPADARLKCMAVPQILAHKWGGGGGPPQGEFNGIGAKLTLKALKHFMGCPFWPSGLLNLNEI